MVAHLGRVLVVDDNDMARALIRVNLELEGFEVVTAVDGLDCLEKVYHVNPAVITLDVVMPRLDGFSTAVRLRDDPLTRHVPIVIITAAAQERDVARGREVGVDAYLTKPFEPTALVEIVRRVTDSRVQPGQRRSGSGAVARQIGRKSRVTAPLPDHEGPLGLTT